MPGCASKLKFFDLRKSLGTSIRNKELKKSKKKGLGQISKSRFGYFTEMENHCYGNELKIL